MTDTPASIEYVQIQGDELAGLRAQLAAAQQSLRDALATAEQTRQSMRDANRDQSQAAVLAPRLQEQVNMLKGHLRAAIPPASLPRDEPTADRWVIVLAKDYAQGGIGWTGTRGDGRYQLVRAVVADAAVYLLTFCDWTPKGHDDDDD